MQSTLDVGRLVAAVTYENLGRSARVCDSLRAHLLALADGELDSRSLEARLGLARDAKLGREARQLGDELGLIGKRSRCLGFGKGQLPRVWFLRDDAQPPARNGTFGGQLDQLSQQKLDVLKRANGKLKCSAAEWWDLARIIAIVEADPAKVWTSEKLGAAIGRHRGTVDLRIQLGRKKRILATRPVRCSGDRRKTAISISWPILEKAADGQQPRDIAPTYRNVPIHERTPSNDDSPNELDAVLEAVDWRKTGLKTEHQWLSGKRLIPLLVATPKARNQDLAKALGGVSPASITIHCRQLAAVGIIAQQQIYEVGSVGARMNRTVMIERLRRCAGDASAAANAVAPSATKMIQAPKKPGWNSQTGILKFGDEERSIAKQASRIRAVLDRFEECAWRDWINTPEQGDRHKDTMKQLRSIKVVTFYSTHSGTAVGWKSAES